MISIELSETGKVQVSLTPEQGHRLASSGVVTATIARHGSGVWTVSGRSGKIGAVRIGDVEVWITPKLPVARLLFLAGYAKRPKGWREETVDLDIRAGLVPAVAQALWRQSERALRQGLIQGYQTVDERSYVLRGRLRENDQLRRNHGRAIPMEIRYDDFTADVAENQILLAAITRMMAVPRVDAESHRHLAALRNRLAPGITSVRAGRLPAWQPTRLNRRYHTVLRLAEVIWQATAPEHSPGSLAINGFLFNLVTIFENFVTTAVSEELRARAGGVAHSPYYCYLDEARALRVEPDLVWELGGRPAVVVDAKYKQEQRGRYPGDDVYQMLTYCTALGLRRGHLVYASGNATAARHIVRHTGMEIVCHALDIDEPPQELLAQVSRIVDELVTSTQAA